MVHLIKSGTRASLFQTIHAISNNYVQNCWFRDGSSDWFLRKSYLKFKTKTGKKKERNTIAGTFPTR